MIDERERRRLLAACVALGTFCALVASRLNAMETPMAKPLLILIGADKGGVGKTTIARLLLDYFRERGLRAPRIFDSECPLGTLKRFAPDAQVIDIERVEDQMRLFDGMSETVATLVDIRAGLLSPTVRTLDRLRLLEDVRRGDMTLAMFHVLGPTPESLREIGELTDGLGIGARYFPVKNHITEDTAFFAFAPESAQAQILATAARVTLTIPHLAERACEEVQRLSASFVGFARDQARSRTLRGLVDDWLLRAFAEFDRLKVDALVAPKPAEPRVVPLERAQAG